jgi:4-hydroxy-tetrahydrodipicolinate synthase
MAAAKSRSTRIPPPSALWSGVFPAQITHLHRNGSLNLEATARHSEILIDSGIRGLIALGSLGENQTLNPEEKRSVARYLVEVVAGRIPVLSGVAESSTPEAVRYVQDGEALGLDGFMVMPPMSYRSPDPAETLAHFRAVAQATRRPVMIYNNPISYGNDVTPEMFARLADLPNVIALKESSGNTRRITDLHRVVGGRYAIFTGVDDLALESAALGIDGWVAGTGIAFPKENQRLWDLMQAGHWPEALTLYRWFTPLLHLDTHPKFVQYIKLCVQESGLGQEWTRPPRLPLRGRERKEVLEIIRDGIRHRPRLPPLP